MSRNIIDCHRAYIGTKMELKPEAFKGKMFKVNERKNFFEKKLKKYLHYPFDHDIIIHGSLVKRLRRRPLTAETRVRFPYGLLTIIYNSPTREQMSRCDICFFVCWILFYRTIKRRLALYWVWNYPDEWTVSGICKYFRVK